MTTHRISSFDCARARSDTPPTLLLFFALRCRGRVVEFAGTFGGKSCRFIRWTTLKYSDEAGSITGAPLLKIRISSREQPSRVKAGEKE
jgi:hypothetical protein